MCFSIAVSAAPEVAREQNMCRMPAYSRILCFDPLRVPVFRVSHLPPEIRVGGRNAKGGGMAEMRARWMAVGNVRGGYM
eukprot:2323508-Prymnesium_polylepis.1